MPVPMATPSPAAARRIAISAGRWASGGRLVWFGLGALSVRPSRAPSEAPGPAKSPWPSGRSRAYLALQPEEDGRHAPQAEARDELAQPHGVVEVVRRLQDLFRRCPPEALGQDAGEPPGGRGLRRCVEPELHPVVVADLRGEEERGLALDHLLHRLPVALEVGRQR